MNNPREFVVDICEYLANNAQGFNFSSGNTNLKVGEIVIGEEGVYAVQTSAQEPDRYTGVENYQIDFTAQFGSTDDCFTYLRRIYNLFHQKIAYQTDNFHVYSGFALGQPEDFDRDLEGRKLMRLSVIFIVRALIS